MAIIPRHSRRSAGSRGIFEGRHHTRGASDLGLTVGSLGFFSALDVVRQALPMALTMLKRALVICLPLVLRIGT